MQSSEDRYSQAAPPTAGSRDLISELELVDDPTRLKDRALAAAHEGITISDARLPDNPIMYANRGFERLTGYSADEVLGRNCRFLQGPETDQRAVTELRRAVAAERPTTVELLNYRKDGSPFWNRLAITPVTDGAGRTSHFIGIQSDVSERRRATEALTAARRELEEANRRMKQDLEAAARIQRSLLPATLPELPGLDAAWVFRPCDELAGDALDLFALDERRAALYLLDVSGHGVPAALLSVSLARMLSPQPEGSALFREPEGAGEEPELRAPAEVAAALNRRIELDPEAPQYATLFYGVLDRVSGVLDYVCAGHPPAIHLPAGGEPRFVGEASLPVGALPEARFRDGTVRLDPGDRLVLYSDGVTEAADPRGRELGRQRLAELLQAAGSESPERALEWVIRAVEAHAGGAALEDDVSLLAVERRPCDGTE